MKKLCQEYNDETNSRQKTAAAKAAVAEASQPARLYVASVFQGQACSHSSSPESSFSQSPVKVEDASTGAGCGFGSSVAKDMSKGMVDNQEAQRQEARCSNERCNKVHELATCVSDLSAENRGFMGSGRHGKDAGKCTNTNKWHVRRRRHAKHCGEDEWRNREIIAGLRGAHEQGRYA